MNSLTIPYSSVYYPRNICNVVFTRSFFMLYVDLSLCTLHIIENLLCVMFLIHFYTLKCYYVYFVIRNLLCLMF